MPRIGRVGDGDGPREWLQSLPPITRTWFLASILTTCLVSFGVLSPSRVVWHWRSLSKKFELWRLVTPFVYFGNFSFPFLINMYLLVQYSRNYEVSPYNTGAGGGSADYLWMLLLGMALLLVISTFMNIVAPSLGLTYMVLYVWSRRNATTQVSLYGFVIQAVYLPWALLALNLVIGNSLVMPIMGIVTGHAYYFAIEPFPAQYDQTLITTPAFIIDLLGGNSGGGSSGGAGFQSTVPPARRNQEAAAPRAGRFNRGGGYNWGAGRPLGRE